MLINQKYHIVFWWLSFILLGLLYIVDIQVQSGKTISNTPSAFLLALGLFIFGFPHQESIVLYSMKEGIMRWSKIIFWCSILIVFCVVYQILSINFDTLPDEIKNSGQRTYRSLTIDGEEIEFSEGFTELHNKSYQDILSGGGFRIGDSRKAIEIVHDIRHQEPIGLTGDYHPYCKKELVAHPFSKTL